MTASENACLCHKHELGLDEKFHIAGRSWAAFRLTTAMLANTAETSLVAIDGVKAILRHVLAIAPTEKRAKIELLIEQD